MLSFSLHLLSALLLVVLTLHVLKFTSQSFDLVLILVHLSLVHVELSGHGFHLAGLFFKVLLVDGELLSNFWTRLSREQVLQLDIELLFFLDNNILLNNLFSLFDESLLQSLDLLKHFPSIWISSLELSPSVAVERVLEFFRKSFNLESLGQKLLLEIVDLLSQIRNLGSLGLNDPKLALVVTDLELEESDIL